MPEAAAHEADSRAEPGDLNGMLAAIERLPVGPADVAATWELIADAVGCILGATTAPAAQPALAWLREQASGPLPLAWALGALSNVLELDAMHVSSSVHPGTVVVPAALAVALAHGSRAQALSRAVLRGTEAAIRIGRSTGLPHRQRFQSTSTCASVGAALACADLLSLRREQALDAMGNAASTAGGLWAFVDEDTLTKQWHAGHAAQDGLACAQLAAHGLRGPRHVMSSHRGFHAVLCPDAAPRELLHEDTGWQIHATAYKPWPCPRPVHPAITAALAMHPQLAGQGAIRSMTLRTFAMAVDLCNRPVPASPHEARFSLQHCVAAAVQDGHIGFDSFGEDAIVRHRELAGCVAVQADTIMTGDYPRLSRAALELVMEDGRRLDQTTDHALGDPELALGAQRRAAKDAALVELLPRAAGGAALSALQSALAGREDAVEEFGAALRGCGVLLPAPGTTNQHGK